MTSFHRRSCLYTSVTDQGDLPNHHLALVLAFRDHLRIVFHTFSIIFGLIADFCDMYQQGCYSYISDGTCLPRHTRDMDTQTSDGTLKNGHECVTYNANDTEDCNGENQTLTMKNLKCKPVVLIDGKRRKRGRPRKIQLQDSLSNSKEEHLSSLKNESNMVKPTSENDDESIDNTEKSIVGSKLQFDDEEIILTPKKEPVLRISKRGRRIIPKKFSDDIISFIKQESDSDSENAGGGLESETDCRNGIEKMEVEDSNFIKTEVTEQEKDSVRTVFACEQCEFTTSKMKEFNDHHREHLHADKKCSYCGWVCDNPDVTDEQFTEHLNNHTGSTPYFCSFCSQRFSTKAKLYQHLPKHSKTKPYICDICQAGFKWKHALKNHMTVHKNSKDYLCDICGFSTAHKIQLKAHHLIHTGNTFKCQEFGCEYQATKRSNLKFHMMTHSREKPHRCELCGQAFSLVKNMKRHMLLHKGDRPFRCEHCTFCTTRFDKLKEHYFKQHSIGEKPKRKFRLTEYLKMQAVMESLGADPAETAVLSIGEELETIELQVAEDGTATTQIVNVTSSIGEAIPIAITQNGGEISYEIQQFPVQIVTQEEIVTE